MANPSHEVLVDFYVSPTRSTSQVYQGLLSIYRTRHQEGYIPPLPCLYSTTDWWTIYYFIMSTPLGGGYIIFAFFAVRCPMSGVRRPMSGVTHGFRSFKGKVLELLSPNLVCRLIGSVACLGLLLAVVPLLLTE